MNEEKQKALFRDIKNLLGEEGVSDKFEEEQAELIQRLSELIITSKKGQNITASQIENYVDEMADSANTMMQKSGRFDILFLINERVKYKLNRTRKKIDKGQL